MIDFLADKFIKNHKDVSDPYVRASYGKLASVIGILCNVLLFAGKIIVGTLFGSVSITADAVNNLSDASSGIISLFGFKLAGKPADEEHPYGHGRYEYLSGLMVAVLIMVIGVELLKSSISKILNPSDVEFSIISVIILSVAVLLKLWMMFFYKKVGKLIDSQTLIAACADSRNDVITTSAVLAASIISRYTRLELDGWIGLLVAAFILISGFGLVKDTIDPMLGAAPDKETVKKIRDKILSYPGVLGTHDLMIHDYGPGRQFASVHVEMAAEGDVIESHEIIDTIERDFCKNDGLHIVVHFDPILTKDNRTNDIRTWLCDKVREIDPRLSIHDLRVVPGNMRTNLIFDCVLPYSVDMTEAQLKEAICSAVRREHDDYNCIITVDKSYAPIAH